jgi:branched-chain amino acid aminotransferase
MSSASTTPTANVWLNGDLLRDDVASVSVGDLGLLHGAGVFTTMAARGGNVFRLGAHLSRLRSSCEQLSIPLTYTDADLTRVVDELLTAATLTDARLRLTVTRGRLREDPQHGAVVEPTVLLTAQPLAGYPRDLYDRGLTVVLLDQWKLNPFDPQAGHKTLDYLSRFAALHEAQRKGAQEAIWFNIHHYAQSGSISNLFVVKDGTLITPPTQAELAAEEVRSVTPYPRSNVLPGVARGAVLDLAGARGIPTRLGPLTVNDLLGADELFVTNSVMLVMPVCRVERHEVGTGKPGPLTRTLSAALSEAVRA